MRPNEPEPPVRPDALNHGEFIASGMGVYDEPGSLPGAAAREVEVDWRCSHCGYNLRGLQAGQRCPECDHVEVYRPPPPGAESFASALRERFEATSARRGWQIAIVTVVLSIPFALLGGMVLAATFGSIPMLVLSSLYIPAVQELLKIAVATMVVELRPYWFRSAEQIRFSVIGCGLLMAVAENAFYLGSYVGTIGAVAMSARWIAFTGMHLFSSHIAAQGLVLSWERCREELRRPSLDPIQQALTRALLLQVGFRLTANLIQHLMP